MSSAPLVSILIATYNRSRLLRRAINSVLMQDFSDYELIVIDDCSPDDTREVVAAINDPRIRYIRNESNVGSQGGDRPILRRFVYELMRGQYFVYLCDDDYWLLPDLLTRQIAAFRDNDNLAMAIGGQLSYFLTTPDSLFGRTQDDTLTLSTSNIDQFIDLATLASKTAHVAFMRAGTEPLFPKSVMTSDEFLQCRAADPAGRNLIGGATLYSRERFVRSGALKSQRGSKWQAGYELMMGPGCYGAVAYFDTPCIVTEIRATNASFRGTQVDHYLDSLDSVEAAFETPLADVSLLSRRRFLRAVKAETIRHLSRQFLGNTLTIKRYGELSLCSEENMRQPVTIREVAAVYWRKGLLPHWDDLKLALDVEREPRRQKPRKEIQVRAVSLAQDRARTKILLSVVVWGSDYVATLADFSLASQMSPDNIPKLAAAHHVTYHIVTTRSDAQKLRRYPAFQALRKHCDVLWDYIEECGHNPKHIPRGDGSEKYPFLSRLQNIAIRRSLNFDVLVFNYADFIWADGSLTNVIEMMRDGVDAVLSFALPVDNVSARPALSAYRTSARDGLAIKVPAREAAGIAIDCLHREAKLRFWDGPRFTHAPTYLIWPVADQGVIVRAYHQTVLALRVRRDDPDYAEGIRHGSLDGYFTARLAETAKIHHAAASDEVFVFSLYDAKFDSALRPGETREQALQACLQRAVSAAQRRFAEIPIDVKRCDPKPALWQRIVEESWNAIEPIQRTTVADPEAFESMNAFVDALSRPKPDVARWLYVHILLPFARAPFGSALKRALGAGRTRTIHLVLERWLTRHVGDVT